jgi:hypothetical protein
MKRSLALLVLSSIQVACSSGQILRDKDYEKSVISFRQSDFESALRDFPAKEEGGFITSIEKSWIHLWEGKFDSKPLLKHTDAFDPRQITRVSREAGVFLTGESEEGYLPSEAEMAVLHLLAAAHLLEEGNRESARVELRRTDEVLNMAWDDPALRLWSAGMWAAIGEWQEAQVDLRRAHKMTGNKELLKWSEERVPTELILQFSGVGPELKWEDGNYTPKFTQTPVAPKEPMTVSTMPWYERHKNREQELHDLMVKSNYMAQYMASEAQTGAERITSNIFTASFKAAGIALGVAIAAVGLYALSQAGADQDSGESAGYILLAGAGVAGGAWKEGSKMQKGFDDSIKQDDRRRNQDMRTYRLVRFMPEYISLKRKDTPCAGCTRLALPRAGTTAVTLILQP